MIRKPSLSSSQSFFGLLLLLLQLALILLSGANGKSNAPWLRFSKRQVREKASTTTELPALFLPPVPHTVRDLRGGSSGSSEPSPMGISRSNAALSTPTGISSATDIATGGHIGTKTKSAKTLIEDTTKTTTTTTLVSQRAGSLKAATSSNTTMPVVPKESSKTESISPKPSAVVPVTRKEKKESKKRHKEIAKKLKNRNAANKRRKFLHAAWGILFASLNHAIPRRIFLPGMGVITATCLTVELLRYRKGFEWMNDLMHKILGKALRKNEMDGKFTGSLYYFSGVFLTSYLYPNPCATLGICQLAIADPTASYFGRATRHVYWSRINNGFFGLGRNKGILGFLGGAISCLPLNYRLLSLATVGGKALAKSTVWTISLALGMAGALADLMVPTPALTLPKTVMGVSVPPFHLDDNIVVPILSGWACVRIFQAASILPPELTLAKYLVVA